MNHESVRTPEATGYAPALIDACRRGERAALSQVLRCESPYLTRVLFRVLGPSSDLEDMLQVTLEQALRAFPSFRGEASVRTWLTRIAVRCALHHLKHPAQKKRAELSLVEGVSEANSRPGQEAEARAHLRVLYEHLAKLDPKHRTAFLLYQVEGRSMEEVAALMDAGVSTTKSRVMWARRKLFARLAKDPRASDWAQDLLHAGKPDGEDT